MNARSLAMLWLHGDRDEWRPSYIAQECVLRIALRDSVKAARIAAELGERGANIGAQFALNLESYRDDPAEWRSVTRWHWERQQAINECRRGKPARCYANGMAAIERRAA